MAWSTPITAAANAVFTAAQWNTSVRDNLNVTAPAIATGPGKLIVTTALNTVAERTISQAIVDASETTTATTYGDNLATTGPTVSSLTCTAFAMVFQTCQLSNSGTASTVACADVSGATTLAPSDLRCISTNGTANKNERIGVAFLLNCSAAGSHTFKLQYKVGLGTGTFQRRRLQVIAL